MVKLHVEDQKAQEKILIVDPQNSFVTVLLKEQLQKYHTSISVSPHIPPHLSPDLCFIVKQPRPASMLSRTPFKRAVFLYINQKKQAEQLVLYIKKHHIPHVKVINISADKKHVEENMESLLWFSFARSPELFLNLQKSIQPAQKIKRYLMFFAFVKQALKKKNIIITTLILFLAYHILFITPLLVSSYFLYQGGEQLKKNALKQVQSSIQKGSVFLKTAQFLYSFARPTFLFFSLALVPDNSIQAHEKARDILAGAVIVQNTTRSVFSLITKKNKSQQEKKDLLTHIESLQNELQKLQENTRELNQKLPDSFLQLKPIKDQLSQTADLIYRIEKVISFSDFLLAKDTERNYLLLFANNMELRPGGGFIGSFGIVSMKDLTFDTISIYDVYDADGKLTAHIEPPDAIKNYLNQPHWFLRDSAFSPDFPENYRQALFFLEKEMGMKDFAGGILITTSAIQQILDAFGTLYLSDFQELVNKDNFYLKAQTYAERQFFPGSTQKKSFLATVARSLIVNIENASSQKLMKAIKTSLDEKQMVLFFEKPDLEELVNSFYWSGQTITSKCATNNQNCIVDYVFPLDANLGVNKANFFIKKFMKTKVKINESGTITNTVSLTFKNESLYEVFPGGTYKNYFQLMLPKDIVLKTITKNGTLVENYSESTDTYHKVAFLLEVPPQTTSEIIVEYTHTNQFNKGNGVYQLIVQKQIGSSSFDFSFDMLLPRNIFLLNQNFSPLVKDNKISYNTNLSADKIFFTELIKE